MKFSPKDVPESLRERRDPVIIEDGVVVTPSDIERRKRREMHSLLISKQDALVKAFAARGLKATPHDYGLSIAINAHTFVIISAEASGITYSVWGG